MKRKRCFLVSFFCPKHTTKFRKFSTFGFRQNKFLVALGAFFVIHGLVITSKHNVVRYFLFGRTDSPRFGVFSFCQFLRSEEHTSELQSRENLVCRLLLEK